MKKVWKSWCFVNRIDVSSDDTKGGLSLCWKQCCIISLHTFSRNHIDVMVEDGLNGNIWSFVGFYGHLGENHWYKSWELLQSLLEGDNFQWLMMGNLMK